VSSNVGSFISIRNSLFARATFASAILGHADEPFAALILGAGRNRMNSDLPKVLHPIAHRPMIEHFWRRWRCSRPHGRWLWSRPEWNGESRHSPTRARSWCKQSRADRDAVMAARGAFEGFDGDVLVLYGDTP